MTGLLLTLAIVAGCIVAMVLLLRKQRKPHPRAASARTMRHDHKAVALANYLQDRYVVLRAIKAGVFSVAGIEGVLRDLGTMTEGEIDAVMFRLLQPREVRMAVAIHIGKNPLVYEGMGRTEALKALSIFVDKIRRVEAGIE